MRNVYAALLFVLFLSLSGCNSSDSGGGGGGGGGDDEQLNGMADALSGISSTFTPDSLAVEGLFNNRASVRSQEGGDPCEDSDSLWDCQPNLLRLYYDIAQGFLDNTRANVATYAAAVSDLEDSSEPTEIEFESDLGTQFLEYTKSDAELALLLRNAPGEDPIFYARSTAESTLVQVGNFGDENGGEGVFQVQYTYVDDENWDAEVYLVNPSCDDTDVGAPQRIKIRVTREDGVWKGKAMMYSELWSASSPTCETEVTNDTAANLFTDFVGNDEFTKAKMFIMRRTVVDFTEENQDAHGIPVCDLLGCEGDDEITIGNPFCVEAGSTTAVWMDSCTSDEAISSSEFGSFSDWTAPNELYTETVALPESL